MPPWLEQIARFQRAIHYGLPVLAAPCEMEQWKSCSLALPQMEPWVGANPAGNLYLPVLQDAWQLKTAKNPAFVAGCGISQGRSGFSKLALIPAFQPWSSMFVHAMKRLTPRRRTGATPRTARDVLSGMQAHPSVF